MGPWAPPYEVPPHHMVEGPRTSRPGETIPGQPFNVTGIKQPVIQVSNFSIFVYKTELLYSLWVMLLKT